MYSTLKIEALVQDGLPGAEAEARDLTGTSDHFELVVVAKNFEGMSRVERHRLVYGLLGNVVGNEIHALSLKTFTPKEAGRDK